LEIVIVLAPCRKHGPNRSYTEDRTLSSGLATIAQIAERYRSHNRLSAGKFL